MRETRYLTGYATEQAAREGRSHDLLVAHWGDQPNAITQFLVNVAQGKDGDWGLVLIDMSEFGDADIDDLATRVFSQAEKNRIKTLNELEADGGWFHDLWTRLGNAGEISVMEMRRIHEVLTGEGHNVRTFKDFADFHPARLADLLGVSVRDINRWQAKARVLSNRIDVPIDRR